MTRPEQAPEPTMDEILASIRRIIADDEQAADEPARAAPASEAQSLQEDDSSDLMRDIEQALGGGETEAAAPQPATEDEIFELTEEVSITEEPAEDDGSAVLADFEALTRELSDDGADATAQVDAAMDEGAADDEFTGALEQPVEIEASLDRGSIPDDFDFEETPVEKAQSDDLDAYHKDTSLPPDVVFTETGDGLDEPAPVAAAMPSPGASGFEEGIKEMLRPLLRSWLDENLPRLVKGALEDEARALKTPKDKFGD
ncbi:MAG: DUF2497 domain-containing protein [Hyphomicrobiales bacterium]